MQTLSRSTLLIAVILAALLVPGVTTAQEPPPDCTPALLAERFAEIGGQITQAEAYLTDNDMAGALEAFGAAAALVDDVRATCGTDTATITVEPVSPIPATSALCNDYPQYCVPFVGGPMVNDIPNEAPGLRPVLSGPSNSPGVVRGLTPEGGLFIGNPDAPIHFLEYLDFACPHCAHYEDETIIPLIQQAVTSGQATYEVRTMTFVAGELSTNAAYAMFCAGEQGAAWEMHDALFAHYDVDQAQAYTLDGIKQIGDELGLDTEVLASCMASGRYADRQASFNTSFDDLGLTGTPSMLVRYTSSDEWTTLDDRSLDNVLALVAAANP
jgi:protein-disulfide isomerase